MIQALLPVLVVGAVAIYYFVYFARGGGRGTMDRHFGLADGETTTAFWNAEFATAIPFGHRAATAALGLLAGAMVGGVGVSTMRPRGISIVLTSLGRMVMCVENQDDSTSLFAFQPGQVGIRCVGDGRKKMQGGPSKILRLEQAGLPPLDFCIHYTAEEMLCSWASGGAGMQSA